MHNSRIICVGNRFVEDDAGGLAVYDKLLTLELPPGVLLIEGGLAGLNLLPHLEQGGKVVFVDAIAGFGKEGSIVVLDQDSLMQQAQLNNYGHEAGVPYLLSVLPHVNDGELPEEIILLGLQGKCKQQMIEDAALLSIQLATLGLRETNAQENT